MIAIDEVVETFRSLLEPSGVADDSLRRAVVEVEAVSRGGAPEPPTARPALRPLDAEQGSPVAAATVVPAPPRVLASEIPGVPDEKWTRFVLAMRTAQPGSVSASNALGAFEMKPKRLADLGLMENLKCTRSTAGRMAWHGDWVRPLTQQVFLKSPRAQYRAFAGSMLAYANQIRGGRIPRPEGGHPEGATLSGILAILHRCGPSGLRTWNDEDNRFPETVALYERANGIF